MSEHEVLTRAVKALRSAHPGAHQGSGFTRARVMTSLHRNRRGRLYRWVIGAPLASVLLVGSAWAQSSGKWPVVWAAVTAVFSPAPEPSQPSSSVRQTSEKRTKEAQPSAPMPALGEPDLAAPIELPVQPPPDTDPLADEATPHVRTPSAEPAPSRVRPRAKPSQSAAPFTDESRSKPQQHERETATAPEPSPPPERPVDPELARFRAAHEIHFEGNQPRRALAAYEEYLREFPRGRFVPEARYNMALDYIKLGDKARARTLLQPFADGAYGNYREREAEQLLEALR